MDFPEGSDSPQQTSSSNADQAVSMDDSVSESAQEMPKTRVNFDTEESNVSTEVWENSIQGSVLGQVSFDTGEEESLDEHAKQLLHSSLERLHLERPRDLPVQELDSLEGQVQGLILGALDEMKEGTPIAKQAGNQEQAEEWLHEALSLPHNNVLPTSDYYTPRSAAVGFRDEASESIPLAPRKGVYKLEQYPDDTSEDPNSKLILHTFVDLKETLVDFSSVSHGSGSEPADDWPTLGEPMIRSSPTEFVENSVTVKFHLSDGEIYTKAYKIHYNIKEVREDLAEMLHFPASMINVYKESVKLDDWLPLAGLGVEPYGTLELVLESADPIRYPITRQNSKSFISDATTVEVPDVINVTVEVDDNSYKELVVEIWNQAKDKPWVGGYRDKRSFREFHHAFTQTGPYSKLVLPDSKTHRNTQTSEWLNKVQNTPSDKATQSTRRDIYIPTVDDKIVTPQKYITHAEIEAKRNVLNKVITIQRYTRGWLIRKLMKSKSKEYKEQLEWEAKQAKLREAEKAFELKKHVTRQVYPQSRADFEMLYSLVERWRLAEVRRISELKTEAPKKAELCYLLEKEIVLLNSIEKHRIRIKKEKLEKKELDFIEKSSKPIEWTGKDGKMISMDTVRTQRARELKQLYLCVCQQNISIEERVNLLISLKHALKTYKTSSRILEIITLMERECDCLVRGLKDTDMNFLRKRIKKTFLELMKDPKFNPEAAKYLPQFSIVQESSNQFKCERCGTFYPPSKFLKTTMSKRFDICVSCSWIENIANHRIELEPFQHIVRSLRRDEQKRCSYSSFAFVMQDEDFYFLINNIWHSHSIISENTDMFQLRLGRWLVKEEWSPWNCILLTTEEMHAHLNLDNVENSYESIFIHDVKLKHFVARNHFKHLEKMDTYFRESGKWFKPNLTIKYEAPSPDADKY